MSVMHVVGAAQQPHRGGGLVVDRRSAVAASISRHASFSHSSDDWWTAWNRCSSRWTTSAGVFCSDSSSSVRR